MSSAERAMKGDLTDVFDKQQVDALGAVIGEIREGQVSREEFERLEAMVERLLERVEPGSTTGVTPEEIVIIAAAVTAFLGKRVRVRGARRIQPAGPSPWGLEGRVFIQASHNLGARKGH